MSFEAPYIKLNREDRNVLRKICKQQWYEVGKRLLITVALPIICTLVIVLALNYIIFRGRLAGQNFSNFIIPGSLEELIDWLGIFGVLTIPIYFIIGIANVVMFLRTVPPIHFDLIRDRKVRIQFTPIPYYVPETNQYYIKTGIPRHPFFEVNYEQYIQADRIDTMFLELSPWTKALLNIAVNKDAR